MKIDQSATIGNGENRGLAIFTLLCGASEAGGVVVVDVNQFGSIIDYWLNQG
jgi:hypothetical protein